MLFPSEGEEFAGKIEKGDGAVKCGWFFIVLVFKETYLRGHLGKTGRQW